MFEMIMDRFLVAGRRVALTGICALVSACMPAQGTEQEAAVVEAGSRQPNIIVILADDLGFNDISLNGNPLVRTPNIDRLATSGIRFSHAYSANAVCAPSRAALLTGRHQQAFGFEFNPIIPPYIESLPATQADVTETGPEHTGTSKDQYPPMSEIGIPDSELTIAQRLKAAGYSTAHIGKWHLGSAPGKRPADKGFDRVYGFLAGAALFAPADRDGIVNAHLEDPFDAMVWANVTNAISDDGEIIHPDRHLTDAFADEAVEFISENREDPFLLYLAFNAPHNPLQARQDYYDRLSFIKDHKTRVYYAMVEQLDDAIGRVLDAVDEAGLSEDTLIIFASDNGGASYTGIPVHNLPYRGWKATFFEGGIVVPMHAYWPGHIQPGQLVTDPVSLLDIAPTILEAAGLPIPETFDGQSLIGADAVSSDPSVSRPFFWRAEHYRVVRDGKYKLQISEFPEKTWLFDLEKDPGEHVNIADAHPDIVSRLKDELSSWEATLAEPIWPAMERRREFLDGYQDPEVPDQEYIYYPL